MKKRGFLLLFSVIFSLILIPKALSIYEESVYSGTVEDGDVIEISGKDFEFRIDSASSKVAVEIDSSGMIIESGNCRIKDNFDVCVKNISFSYRNLTTYTDIYRADVEVYRIKSSVDVAHTIDKNSILIDEEAVAELSVENTADIVAKDFTATIPIPNSISVIETEGCKKSLNSIVFKEEIHPKQIKKCTYKIKGLYGDDFDLTATISYFNGIETVSAESPISVKVYNYSLKISSEANKSTFGIGEKLNLTIGIKNINDQYALTITTLNIKIPNNLLIIKKPKDAVRNNQILSWSGNLMSNEEKSFVMELQPQRTGNYSITTEASYKISKFLRSAKHKSAIEVICDCPYISREISPKNYAPGDSITLNAFLINPDELHSFSKIKIDYSTNIPGFGDFSASHPKINPKGNIGIFSSSFKAPELDKSYYLDITAVYSLDNDEVFVVKDYIMIGLPGQEASGIEEPIEEEVLEEEILEEAVSEDKEEDEESGEQEIPKEDIPVTTLEKEENPLKTYMMIAFIAAIIFIVVVMAVFKRKAGKKEVPKPVKNIKAPEPKKRLSIKEMLHLDLLKSEKAQIKGRQESKWKMDDSYRDLKRQIDRLGIQPEGYEKKKGFWFFRRK